MGCPHASRAPASRQGRLGDELRQALSTGLPRSLSFDLALLGLSPVRRPAPWPAAPGAGARQPPERPFVAVAPWGPVASVNQAWA